MIKRGIVVVVLAFIALVRCAEARTIEWSGYTWDVRNQGLSQPGPNVWSDSAANVTVDGSELVLSIVKDSTGTWTSAEVDNRQHLGYGTYRWVVNSDLSKLDAHEVLGLFTWGDAPPSNNEIDIEAARWGNLAWPSGSGTVWQDSAADQNWSQSFSFTDKPPYVAQFTWHPGVVKYLITDATGAVLFEKTVTSGVPVPSVEVPIINYWRFENQPPAASQSMRIASFQFVRPGADAVASAHVEPTPDTHGPTCTVKSPRARTYRVGQRVRISRSCSDASGVISAKAVLRTPHGAKTVRSGARVRVKRAGTYRLTVTARDPLGNRSVSTVPFRVKR